jgi:hypothetical protein
MVDVNDKHKTEDSLLIVFKPSSVFLPKVFIFVPTWTVYSITTLKKGRFLY